MEQRLLRAGRWASDTALQLATGITKFFGTLVGEAISGRCPSWFVVLYCVVYVVMTPLLYVADNHEVALHEEGIEVVELSEDVVNFGVDLGNVGLDAPTVAASVELRMLLSTTCNLPCRQSLHHRNRRGCRGTRGSPHRRRRTQR